MATYPAAEGPALYAMNRGWVVTPGRYLAAYQPLDRVTHSGPPAIHEARRWYTQWWVILAGRQMGLLPPAG